MIETNSNIFNFGVSSAPYALSLDWPIQEWDNDFKTMKELNFNTVRIFAAWERIETADGVYDFSKQDYAMSLAQKYCLQIVMQFGGMFEHYCGYSTPSFFTGNVCPDNPEYRRRVDRFMAETVMRYADHPNLYAWMIWNEPHADDCTCPHTITAYQSWLEKKYSHIDALNRAWSTQMTCKFSAWSEIPVLSSTHVQKRDWNLFRANRMASLMSDIDRIVKDNDPYGHPTTSNIVYHLAALEGPVNSVKHALDIGQIGQCMDIQGISCYSMEHLYDPEIPAAQAYKLSRLCSVSKDPHKRVFLLETGAGPNIRSITEPQRIRYFWQLIGHNIKMILLWNYRSRISDFQVGLFNLMNWDGTPSRRAEYISKYSGILQKNALVLNTVYPENRAAVMTLEINQIMMDNLCSDSGHTPENYRGAHESRIGAYKMLFDLKIGADCITEFQIEKMGAYKIILLPMMEHISKETAARIRDYVANGGTVIAESPFAFRDESGILQYHAPGFELADVFGGYTRDRESYQTSLPILCPEGSAKVCTFWSYYIVREGAEVLARYGNGTNAVVANNYGKGRAIIAGTEIFRQYVRDPQNAMTRLIHTEILRCVEPDAVFMGNADDIEVCRMAGAGGILYLIINHTQHEKYVALTLRDEASWIDMITGRDIDISGVIELKPEQTYAILSANNAISSHL